MAPKFFATPSELRVWLAQHHDKVNELCVGFYKRSSGKPSITWQEAVDAALCFGWIDGVRKSVDEISYTIRLTPRKPRSIWSAINIRKVRELTKQRLMHPKGLEAFQARTKERSRIYSYEQRNVVKLDPLYEKKLRMARKAYEYFQTQAPWYKRTCTFWVMSAKKEETRLKRLATLIECSREGRSIKPLSRPEHNKKTAASKKLPKG